ncbi:phosphopantetheine-binding protein [Streptomyces sp. NPDC096193]|uniref:phosphopantetheine-binding protein n=1 Tax=Streptomyces sp. NPDC096193 TaxID=3155821 RepID=UPI003318F6E5
MALTVQQIRQDVADVLGEDPTDIPDDEDLGDHGLDSVRLMSLVEWWRREHAAEISFVDLAERPAIEVWAALMGAHT